MISKHPLGHRLIECQSQGKHFGAGIGNLQHFQQGGHLCFACIAEMTFTNIEANIRFVLPHCVHQAQVTFEKLTLMPAHLDRVNQCVDRR